MLNIDPKDKKSAQQLLRLGKNGEFWKILCQALDESIQHLQNEQDSDDLKDLDSERYKLEAELLKAKRRFLKHLKNLPETLAAYLEEPAGNSENPINYDPFYSEAELSNLEK